MNATEPTSVKRILLFFVGYTMRSPLAVFGVAFLVVVAGIANVFIPFFYKKFFDVLPALPLSTELIRAALIYLVIAFSLRGFSVAIWRVISMVDNYSNTKIMQQMTEEGFHKLIRHSHDFFSNSFLGSLTRKLNRLQYAYETVRSEVLFSIVPLFVSTIGIFFVVFARSSFVAWILMAWFISFLILTFFAVRIKQKHEVARSEADTASVGILSDSISNYLTVKIFSGFAHEESLVSAGLHKLNTLRRRVWGIDQTIVAIQGAALLAVEIGVMLLAFRFYREGTLTLGDFLLFQVYIGTFSNHIFGFGKVLRRLYQGFADSKEMIEIIDQPYDVKDIPTAAELLVGEGAVAFHDVTFNFQETRAVLENFSLTIAPNEKVALVGPSGAGKTTVTKLLFRFYDPASGHITIDGQDISRVTQESLRDAIALVPQEPVLFHRSLLENIRYGKRDATDEEVYEAAKKAHCHEFIKSLPEGYHSLVGERGIKLSGGERQRVAIARAILKDAPILVLDEATSSLDSESEHLIQEALRILMEGKTVIVIAHRLSTIIKMDRIIVIEDGNIRAMGTHNELLDKDDLYSKLWSIQAGGFLKEENED